MRLEEITAGLIQLLNKNNYNPVTIQFYQREWTKIGSFLNETYGDTSFDIEKGLSYLEKQYGLKTRYNDGTLSVVRQINIRSKIKLFAAGKGVICSLCQIIVRSYSNYLRLGRFLSGISLSPAIDVGLFLLLLLSRVFHADARMICSSFTSRISFHFPQVFWFFKRVFSIAVLLDEAVIGNRDFLWIQ